MSAVIEETIKISEKFLLGDLLRVILGPVKSMPVGWGSLPEADQEKLLDEITEKVTESVRQTVLIIAADARPHMKAVLESVTFKDGIRAVTQVQKDSADRHDLADAQGDMVLLVLPNSSKYLGGDLPTPDPDQPDLLKDTWTKL